MWFRGHKNLIDSLISKVYPIIPSRRTLPALSDILIEGSGGKIYMSATDLETSATAIGTGLEILEEGSIALNGRDLYGIIKELPSSVVEFKVDNLLATIECEKGRFNMTGIGKDEFPILSKVNRERKVNIPYNLLERGIDKILFAASSEGAEAYTGSMLLDLHQDNFCLVATDGRKLALFKNRLDVGRVARLLIPSKVWREVSKFSSGIEIAFEENRVGFFADDIEVVSRLIEMPFPAYESAIPSDNDKLLTVSKDTLVLAVRRALVFAPEISRFVKFILKPNTLLIETTSEVGESREELPCKYEHQEFEIAYNGSYLLSIITKIDSDEVQFLFKDSESAVVITPTEQKEGEEITYLLMPIRLE